MRRRVPEGSIIDRETQNGHVIGILELLREKYREWRINFPHHYTMCKANALPLGDHHCRAANKFAIERNVALLGEGQSGQKKKKQNYHFQIRFERRKAYAYMVIGVEGEQLRVLHIGKGKMK